MQIFKRFALSVLRLAQLLNKVLLNWLKLFHLVTDCTDLALMPNLALCVEPRNLFLLLLLRECLVLQELSLVVTDIRWLMALPLKVCLFLHHSLMIAIFLFLDSNGFCFLHKLIIHVGYVNVLKFVLVFLPGSASQYLSRSDASSRQRFLLLPHLSSFCGPLLSVSAPWVWISPQFDAGGDPLHPGVCQLSLSQYLWVSTLSTAHRRASWCDSLAPSSSSSDPWALAAAAPSCGPSSGCPGWPLYGVDCWTLRYCFGRTFRSGSADASLDSLRFTCKL